MANDKFTISDALKYGWDTFKSNWGFFIGLMVAIGLLTLIPDAVSSKIFPPRSVGLIVVKLLLRLLALVVGIAITRISLDIHDHGRADLSRLADLMPLLPSYVGSKLLYGVIVFIGLLLLVIPGLIVAYMFLYVGYLVVDRQLGPIAALTESRALTDGYKWDLFWFSLVVAVLNVIGALLLGIGLLATIPTTMMASVYIYRKLAPAAAATTPAA